MKIGTAVRIIGARSMYGSPAWIGKRGVVTRLLTPEQAYERYAPGETHVVTFREWGPEISICGSGEPCEYPDGVVEYAFDPIDLKSLDATQAIFWDLFSERRRARRENKNARKRAHRACNLMRMHQTDAAAEIARSCHPIDLFLSSVERPPHFRTATRLDLDTYVLLCQFAGKDEGGVADTLYHLRFENQEPVKVGGILTQCICGVS